MTDETGGRPTVFKGEYVKQAKKLAHLGATDMEIADFFGVSVRTLHRWKLTQPRFCHSLKAGKNEADDKVERSLFQRATGFEHKAIKLFMPAGSAKPVAGHYREFVVSDTTAAIFWLKNRRPEQWRDRMQHEHSGKVTLEGLVCGDTASDD